MRLIALNGEVWRILLSSAAASACHPVRSPEGRFHHSAQPALYTSLSREGAGVGIHRYLRHDDPPRVIARLYVSAPRIADLRDAGPAVNAVWQDARAAGHSAPTWALSDAARQAGANGILYPSRSRPDLKHLTLFSSPPQIDLACLDILPWQRGAD